MVGRMVSGSVAAGMALAVLAGGAMPAAAAPHGGGSPAGKQRVIVQMHTRGDVEGVATEARRGGTVGHVYSRVLDGFVAELPPQAVAALQKNPKVRAVTPDAPAFPSADQANAPWNLDRLDQRGAAPDATYRYDTTGRGVTAYVVDTGIRLSHTDFGGRAQSGYDFVDDDTDAADCGGHGTHVAGTIGGATSGVAKEVRLVSLRVFPCSGGGSYSDVIAAVDWAVAHRQGPSVINYSGSGGAYAPMDEAVARATAAGVPVVVAAGNENGDACTRSPGREPTAITVGAVGSTDARADFPGWWGSNHGACVDIFAPGVDVLSSTVDSDTSRGAMSGTSMATPHVTGAVARYLQAHPAAAPAEVSAALGASATRGVVGDARSEHDGLLHLAPPPVLAAQPVPTKLISESFGTSAGGMRKVLGGTWGVASGRYRVTSPVDSSAPNANLAVHGTAVTGDFTLAVKASTTPTTSTWNDFSVVFGYQDPSNYYYASFNESNNTSTSGIFRVSRGVRTQLADIPGRITAGTTYGVRVERQGSAIRVYRSGTLVAKASDSTFTGGKVGVGTDNDSATYDDLTVSQ